MGENLHAGCLGESCGGGREEKRCQREEFSPLLGEGDWVWFTVRQSPWPQSEERGGGRQSGTEAVALVPGWETSALVKTQPR